MTRRPRLNDLPTPIDAGPLSAGVVSASRASDETTALVPSAVATTNLSSRSSETFVASTPVSGTVSGSTGRTWPDLAFFFIGDSGWHYLLVLLLIGLVGLATGHLGTPTEIEAAGGLLALSWIVLLGIHRSARKKKS